MTGHLPRIIFSSQYGSFARSGECDCACPTGDLTLTVINHLESGLWQQADLFQDIVDVDHRLFFNTFQGQEVVILNNAACQLWQQFDTPRSFHHLPEQEQIYAQQMAALGLLEPASGSTPTCQPVPDALNVWLHVTNTCNLNCSYCYVQKSNERMSYETGVRAIDASMRSAVQGGFKRVQLKYSGGEPTLELELIYQLHAYAQTKANREGLEVDGVILSNGAALKPKDLKEIKTRGLSLMLSLDGVASFHDDQRPLLGGQGSFEHVWRTLEDTLQVGLYPFVSITVTGDSAQGLPGLVGQLLNLGLPFNLNLARPNGSGRPLGSAKIIAGLQETFKCIEAKLPEYNLLGSLLDRAFFAQPHDRPCEVGKAYLVIDHKGQISPCQMLLGEKVTDINAEDPLAIVQSVSAWRNPSVDEKAGCRDCRWCYVCAGGCPLTAYRANGRYDVASPFCEIYQATFPEILRLEGLRILKYSELELVN